MGLVKPLLFLVLLILSHQINCEENKVIDADVIEAGACTETPQLTTESEAESTDGVVKYNGAQLWRVPYINQTYKNAVVQLQKQFKIAMWNLQESHVDLFVKQPAVQNAKKLLIDSNVPFEIVIDNLQKAIDEENPPREQIVLWQNRNGHPMTWSAYHRLSDIHKYLDYLATTYPNLCSVQSIGKSIENRDLKVLRISDGNPSNKAIWVDGGIHAREWISPAVVTYTIDQFVENWEEQPDFVRNIDWYFLPVMNPDGYEYSHTRDRYWRKNRRRNGFRCSGVDLNRNYGYKWGGKGTSKQPCSEVYAGSGPFSEPETKAVQDFHAKSAANFKASLSFHSYGQYILYPWGYDKVVPADHEDLERVGKEAADAIKKVNGINYSVGASGTLLYPAAGASDDWAKAEMKIKYAYTVELRDGGRHGFNLPASMIAPTGTENMELIYVIARAANSA